MAIAPGISVHESFQLDAVVAVAMLVKERNVRVHKHHTMKAYEGGCRPGLYFHAFLTWSIDGYGWSAGLPRPLRVWDRTCGRYPINRLSIPQGPSDCGVKGKYNNADGNPSPVIRYVAGVNCELDSSYKTTN
jgi:hypothetical protein